jgi:hypothetical protein
MATQGPFLGPSDQVGGRRRPLGGGGCTCTAAPRGGNPRNHRPRRGPFPPSRALLPLKRGSFHVACERGGAGTGAWVARANGFRHLPLHERVARSCRLFETGSFLPAAWTAGLRFTAGGAVRRSSLGSGPYSRKLLGVARERINPLHFKIISTTLNRPSKNSVYAAQWIRT